MGYSKQGGGGLFFLFLGLMIKAASRAVCVRAFLVYAYYVCNPCFVYELEERIVEDYRFPSERNANNGNNSNNDAVETIVWNSLNAHRVECASDF